MNPVIRDIWLAALRGETFKGVTFQPNKGDALKDETGYDPAGVLCELHAQATGNAFEPSEINGMSTYQGHFYVLPQDVVDWAGLSSDEPKVPDHDNGGESSISELFDNGKTFMEISNLIEIYL